MRSNASEIRIPVRHRIINSALVRIQVAARVERGVSFTLELVLRWSADGSVAIALADGEEQLSEIAASCMRAQLTKAKWPSLAAGTAVRLPLRFVTPD